MKGVVMDSSATTHDGRKGSRSPRGGRYPLLGTLASGLMLLSLILTSLAPWATRPLAALQVGAGEWCGQNPFSVADLNGDNGFTIEGTQIGAGIGLSVAGGFDFDGDGYGDMLIGSRATGGWIVYGGETFTPTLSLDPPGGRGQRQHGAPIAYTHIPTNPFDFNRLGREVTSPGDFNGDGYDDAALMDDNGLVVIVPGSANPPAVLDPSMEENTIVTIEGIDQASQPAISPGGNFNDDLFDDLTIGDSEHDRGITIWGGVITPTIDVNNLGDSGIIWEGPPGSSTGFAVASYDAGGASPRDGVMRPGERIGGSGGPTHDPNEEDDRSEPGKSGAYNVGSQNNKAQGMDENLFELRGVDDRDLVGVSIAFGDVNGDNLPEMLTGMKRLSNFRTEAIVGVFNVASRFGTIMTVDELVAPRPGDEAAEGTGTAGGANGFIISGSQPFNGFSENIAIGDVYFDGRDDILLSELPGTVYVVPGGDTFPTTILSPDVFRIDIRTGFITIGERIPVAAGDVNGDNIPDLIVGDTAGNVDEVGIPDGRGKVYVLFGCAAPQATPTATVTSVLPTSTATSVPPTSTTTTVPATATATGVPGSATSTTVPTAGPSSTATLAATTTATLPPATPTATAASSATATGTTPASTATSTPGATVSATATGTTPAGEGLMLPLVMK